jgi:hypothetical protein
MFPLGRVPRTREGSMRARQSRAGRCGSLVRLVAGLVVLWVIGSASREARAYSFITHGRVAVAAWDKFHAELASRIGPLGNKNGSLAEQLEYYRYRNAFVYGSIMPDAGAIPDTLSPSARAIAEKVFAELNARRVKGHPIDLSLQEVTPWPASSHSIQFALDYLLRVAWSSTTDRKEKIAFALGFITHILQDNYDSLIDIPYQVARSGVGDLSFGQEFRTTAAIEVGGILNSGTDLFFPASLIDFGETSVGIKTALRPRGQRTVVPVPVNPDYVVHFNLPAFLREALQLFSQENNGSPVPTELGLRNTLKLFMVGVELLELPKGNWASVLETFFKRHLGTAEILIHRVLGRNLLLRFEGGQIKIVFDFPGPFDLVKSISPEQIRLAGRRFLEGYFKLQKLVTLLHYAELPAIDVLGVVSLRFGVRAQYQPRPQLFIDLWIGLRGGKPTPFTMAIDLPHSAVLQFLDMTGKVLPLLGQAFYPGLNYRDLLTDIEAALALHYGLLDRRRYEDFWLRPDPVGGQAMSEFIAAHVRHVAAHADRRDWNGDRWLDNSYWPFVCDLVRRHAVTQSLIQRHRERGETLPPFHNFPELAVFDVRYLRGAERIYALSDLEPHPIDVEVEVFSPLWVAPSTPFDLVLRVKADDPLAGHRGDRVVASARTSVNLATLALGSRIASQRGERLVSRLRFTSDPRDYGYHVEVAAVRGGTERIFYTTDLEPFVGHGIEREQQGRVVGRRLKMDRSYSTFVPTEPGYLEGLDLKSLRHAIPAALNRPYPIGAPHGAPGLFAVESAGFYDGSFVKFRAGDHVERVQARGMNLLVHLPNGALERKTFDTSQAVSADVALYRYLESLPRGSTVLLGISDDGTQQLRARRQLAALLQCPALLEVGFRDGWAAIARKLDGKTSFPAWPTSASGNAMARPLSRTQSVAQALHGSNRRNDPRLTRLPAAR